MGLLRIALALLAWAQIGDALALFRAEDAFDLLLGAVFYPASLAMLLGFHGRAATALTGLCLVASYHHLGAGHAIEDLARHQSWLLAVAVLALAVSPASRSWSIDRLRHPERPEWGSRWGLRLIALQLSVVYLFGALEKCNAAFLGGDRLAQILAEHHFGADLPAIVEWLSAPVSMAVVALEAALAFGLWFSRARAPLMLAGAGLHASFQLLVPVGTFSLLVLTLYLAYLDPEQVDRWLARLGVPRSRAPSRAHAETGAPTLGARHMKVSSWRL